MVRRYSSVFAAFCLALLGSASLARAQAGTISGTVTLASGGPINGIADGGGISGVTVRVYNGDSQISATTTGTGGTYTFTGLSTGNTYRVATYAGVISPAMGLVDQVFNSAVNLECGGCQMSTSGGTTLNVGTAQTGKNFALRPGPRIKGKVTDLAGNPLVNANVSLFVASNNFSSNASSVQTDSLGDFISAAGFPVGNFAAFTFNGQGFIDRIHDNLVCIGGGCAVGSGTPIPITGAMTSTTQVTLPDFRLERGGVITGIVRDGSSAPIPFAFVQIFNSTGIQITSTSAASNGTYASAGLPNGSYYVKASNFSGPPVIPQLYNLPSNIPCVGCAVTSGAGVAVTSGNTATNIDFALQPAGSITGTLRDATTTTPISNASVQVYAASGGQPIAFSNSNSSGVYTVTGLPTGNYILRASGPFSGSPSYISRVYTPTGGFDCSNCDVTGGSLVAVTAGSPTSLSDLSLTQGGSISGTVFDNASGSPIANVNVSLLNASGSQVSGNNTNSSGVFTMNGLLSGTYYLRTNASSSINFIPEIWAGGGAVGGVHVTCSFCSVNIGTAISVTAGTPVTGKDFRLVAGRSVGGIVTNTAGTPLGGISVNVFDSNNSSITGFSTNSSGAYTIAGLAPGTYFVRTFASGGFLDKVYNDITCLNCSANGGTPIDLTAGSRTDINFTLAAGGRISGKITDPTGAPLASSNSAFVGVNIYSSTGFFVSSVSTAADGTFLTGSGLPPGTYYVSSSNALGYINTLYNGIGCFNCPATSGTPIVVTAGTTTGGINLVLSPGASIKGTVTSSASGNPPLVNAFVQVFSSTGSQLSSTFTNSLGVYTLGGLTTGSYFVRTNNGLGFIDQLFGGGTCLGCDVTTGQPVPATIGSTTSGINFTLNSGGAISGTVTDASTSALLAGVQVQVYTSFGQFVTSVITQSNGTYALRGLDSGNYFVRTFNNIGYINLLHGASPAQDIICGSCAITSGAPIAVTSSGTTTGVNFALSVGGTIKGKVTMSDGTTPIGGVSFNALTSTGSSVSGASSDASGNYTLSGLVPGTYFIKTFNSQGFIDQVYNGTGTALECVSCTVTAGFGVTITQGSTQANINFSLLGGGRIRGLVTDAGGNPIQGVTVQVSRSSGSSVGSVTTGADGRYVSGSGLPAGDYVVRTSNSLGYVDKLYDNITCLGCSVSSGKVVTLTGAPSLVIDQSAPVSAVTTATGIDFALVQGGSFAGTITAAGGAPLQGVTVQAYTADAGQFVGFTSTNGAGNYVLRGLPTGAYVAKTFNSLGFIDQLYNGTACNSCSVTGGTRIAVSVGATTPAINFSLTTGGRFTGSVTAAAGGAPVSNVSISVYSTGGVFMTSGFTSPAGIYNTGGLPAGNYLVRTSFNSSGFINMVHGSTADIICQSCSTTIGAPVPVTLGAATPVNFSLAAGGSISGMVKDSASTPAPLGNVNVSVYTSSGSFVNGINTAADGTFSVRGLPTGSYVVKTFNSLGFIDKQYDNQVCVSCNPTAGTPVAVTAGSDRSGVNFNLTPGGVVSGTITDATNAPLAGISVQFYNSSNFFVASTTTDNLGKYTTRSGLPAGTYFARTGNSTGFINVIYPTSTCQNCSATIGTPILVTVGQTTPNINFVLAAGGRISGTVTDGASGLPLANISVSVYLSDGTFVGGTGTNANGGYSTPGLPTGTYFVRTNNGLGYVNRLYDAVNCMRCSVATGKPISVVTGATTANINLALTLGGRVSGTVTDAATGAPLPGATVQVYDAGGFSVTGATADATGQYTTFTGLIPGTYYARTFNQIGYINKVYDSFVCLGGTTAGGCFPTNGKPFAVTSGATLTGINFALAAGGRVAGTITSGGAPVSGAFANVFSSGGTILTRASAGSGGQYITPDGLPAGSYYVVTENQSGLIDQLYNGNIVDPARPVLECGFSCAVTTGKLVDVVAAGTTPGINFDLTPGGRISGQVTDKASGAPIANTEVDVYNAAGAAIAYGRTDGLGNYTTFGGVRTGTYFVQTFSFSSTNQHVNKLYNDITCPACDPITGTGVAVTTGATTAGINFALDTGEVIGGTITDAATGRPISGAGVVLFDDRGRFVASARTNDSGGYVMSTGVPAGTYFAKSNSFDYVNRLYDTDVCLACDVTRGTPITVDGIGSTDGINFALTAGGHIAGTVTATAGGAAVAGSRIRLFSSSGSFIGQTFTNGVGAYITAGLPPGNYFVRTANTSGFIDELYNNAPCVPCTQSQGAAVTVVTAGLKGGIDFALDSGGLISGFIRDQATGSPIKGVTVSVYRASDGVLVATTDPTDANGYYRISLPVGTYQVEPSAVAGFRPALAALRGPAARSTVSVDTGTETTGVGFSLVACAPLTVNPATLPLGAQGQLYGSTLTATGGTAPFTFSISDGNPNTGLALAASGLLAGTPVFAGTGNFTVAATDANQCAGTRVFALTACSFFLSTSSRSSTASAGTASVTLTASAIDCPWLVTTSAPWITLTSAVSGTGNATVTFSYAFNASGAARSGTIRIGGQVFTVTQGGTSSAPAFGQVDTPLAGATGVVGSLAVTGWALDDVEVKFVRIYRSPVGAEASEVYLGDATMVEGARPDVAAANPGIPFNTRAGWGYLLLTNMLPNQGNGVFTLHMDATDAEGNVTRLGSRTFTGNNASSILPFGAIDTPGQGATISGSSFVNFGWALTPNPKAIPTNGSTVTIYIDSVPVGNPTYNNFRADVAGLFPGLANSGGAIGFKVFDTTTFTNGVHTISWVVFDDAGQAEGIGSRYFTVNNVLASLRFSPSLSSPARSSAMFAGGAAGPAVSARTGFSGKQTALELPPDAEGGRFVAVGQLSRVELRFGQACGPVTAAQVAGGERLPLPVGATMDPSGSFAWMPGPAFLGTYQLEFSVPSCGGGDTTVPVLIAVLPRR